MKTIAITGASGFIGRHLVTELGRVGVARNRVLTRSRQHYLQTGGPETGVEIIEGDLREPESLRAFLEPGCTVVHLVYLRDQGETENIAACANLLEACRAAKIGRLVHCSTVVVVGRAQGDLVTESTACHPVTEYGITKLKLERIVLESADGHFDAAILRPDAVFGPGGENLKKLAGDLVAKNRLRNYLKSCLFGKRRMNLVHVGNVVASIVFLANRTEALGGEVFNITDDDDPSNNFSDVERILMREINIPDYRLPRIPMPPGLLAFLLRSLGRDNINPRCDYSPSKLVGLGFERPVRLESGLAEFASWYRSSHLCGKE